MDPGVFQEHDVVERKSDPGLRMYVWESRGERTRCTWIDRDGAPCSDWFDSDALQLVYRPE